MYHNKHELNQKIKFTGVSITLCAMVRAHLRISRNVACLVVHLLNNRTVRMLLKAWETSVMSKLVLTTLGVSSRSHLRGCRVGISQGGQNLPLYQVGQI